MPTPARCAIAFCLAFLAVLALPAAAQVVNWPLGLTSTLQFAPPAIGPTPISGVTFDSSGAHLYVTCRAAAWNSEVYSYVVTRDPATSRVIGLSAATLYAPTPYADGGLELHAGLLWWTKFSWHQVGQFNPVNGTTHVVNLPPAWQTTGGLTFVPAGYPNAGTLLVSSWSHGDIYSMPLIPTGGGFFDIGPSTLFANIPVLGSEGMVFVTSGPLAGHLLLANYSLSRIDAIPVDATTGLPVGGSATPTVIPLVTGISGPEGLAIDPVTGDLFIGDYSGNKIWRVDGMNTMTALASDRSSVSAGPGGAVRFFVRAGSAKKNRQYAIAASASGTAPGTPIGAVTVPLNVDPLTNFVIANLNTPLFTNFLGTTDATGAAVATFNLPPTAIGFPIGLDFAGALLDPIDLATNAVHLTVVP
jgi:hypothetical protein